MHCDGLMVSAPCRPWTNSPNLLVKDQDILKPGDKMLFSDALAWNVRGAYVCDQVVGEKLNVQTACNPANVYIEIKLLGGHTQQV
jgi:hypothetical protein